MRGLNLEDLVVVCDALGLEIRSYSGLAAVAAVTNPHLMGIPVHSSQQDQARAVRETVHRLEPLREGNGLLVSALIDVLAHLNSQPPVE
ncbi:hypothetical protein [Corynebacterium tapiri]|uniref:TetR family transcriptional regulator n=1 Tax=Corynebacterium tapiri TaxID=1448266 RepID=A0A5C4U4E2_9CORY|nr:hypothetical protein [Corynebacterium tapiri]TNL96850.1 hypothetical protein FHE74_07485 [Corynebacterium tapiri]